MRSRMIAFCCGILAVSRLGSLPTVSPWWLLLPALLCGLALPRRKVLGIAGGAGLGVCWSLVLAMQQMGHILPEYLEGRDFWVLGEVSGLPQRSGRAVQLIFEVERSCFALLLADCPERSTVFSERRILLNFYGDTEVEPAQRWWLRVRLNRPHGFVNPGGFDYEAWLLQQGIVAKGYVRDNPFNTRLEDAPVSVSLLRFRLRERLREATSGLPHAGTIAALVLGDREEISVETWSVFTATGTNHLLVISGLHVGFIAGLGWLATNRLLRLLPGALLPAVLLRVPAQKSAAVAAIACALLYSLLAGFSVPTQRAFIMVSVFMAGRVLGRELPASVAYWLALAIVLAINPMSVTGAGLWLSFGAVGTLLLAFAGLRRLRTGDEGPSRRSLASLWKRWGRPQVVVTVGMTVPLAVWMQQMSLLSPLANIVAIPLVSTFVVPLCLLGTALLWVHAPAGEVALRVADALLELLMAGLAALMGAWPALALWDFFGVSAVAVACAGLASLLLLAPAGWPARGLALPLLLPLLFPPSTAPPEGQADVVVLDVGQGLAVVVRTARHVLVYDTGPRFSDSFDAGRGVVFPYLRHSGVKSVDQVLISHGDNDHIGGLASLLELLPVGGVSGSAQVGLPDDCRQGQSWQWDGVLFQVFHPAPGFKGGGNDGSCVLQVRAGAHSVLLPGDIEAAGEAQLLGAHEVSLADGSAHPLRSNVVIAPHHGSATSSSIRFVAATQADFVVYSAGYRSQFGHPAALVTDRYAQAGADAFNTALTGALHFRIGRAGALPAPRQQRLEARRYWYGSGSNMVK